MKKYILLIMVGLLCTNCSGQDSKAKTAENDDSKVKTLKEPEGNWTVNKEFDEQGNLIRYDSIYSWSSHDMYNDLSESDKDSVMQSFKSRFFTNFSGFENQGFDAIFLQDSLFSNHFFNDDFFDSNFGNDVMKIDQLRQQMMDRQRKFLEKYQSEFIKTEDED
ncbi:hypothetical protein [Winogradskyella psychrotolerans]|uniref:hypothetical protein n=1 Tax=Winogradskyella psychrotolerans TaxID=1344585 RepID=UPI001C06FBD0|nr:hypothetical protein [Winogradskyella psychrotolerans]MBU2930161.1 hypothetical protein [Winogradskyella psychrotolerans]